MPTQGVYRAGARYAGRLANRIYGSSPIADMPWSRAVGGDVIRNIGRGLRGISSTNVNTMAANFAVLGGIGGATSGEEGIGILPGAVVAGGLGGMGMYAMNRFGPRFGNAYFSSFMSAGKASADFIGKSYTRAANAIRGLGSRPGPSF